VSIVAVQVVVHAKEKAVEVGRAVLEERLAAGYNLFPVESAFWWKGEILEEQEVVLVFKTRTEHVESIVAHVVRLTGAEVPDVFVSQAVSSDERYRAWVEAEAAG
jgi:periplasmic divalent cation tolerance protein